jgi:hypothetical protein
MNDESEYSNIVALKDFEENSLLLDDIFLDPNNPRFSNKVRLVSDSRIIEEGIQKGCFEKMEDFSIKELKDSISRIGFLPIDKIVVRPIAGSKGQYVVVEGNRRITALKQLKQEYDKGEINLSTDVLKSITKLKVYIYGGKEKDIAWIVQGIRHISGIKDWKPYQQAKLLANLVSEKGIKIEEVGKIAGTGPVRSARLIRSYYAYEQSRADDEFGEYLTTDDFSFFQEAVFQSLFAPLQGWLEWDEKSKEFKNTTNLKKYLSWFVSIEEGKAPRINRSIDARDILGKAISGYPLLFQKFESDPDMTIKQLGYQIWNEEAEPQELNQWLELLKEQISGIEKLPDVKIKRSKDLQEFIRHLKELKSLIKDHLKTLESK